MKKRDIINSLSSVFPTQGEAKEAVEKIFLAIRLAIRNGDRVVISELGTFKPYLTKAKRLRDIKSGELIQVAPKKKVRFHQAKDLFD